MMNHDKHSLQKPLSLSNRSTLLQNHLKNFAKIGLLLGLIGVIVDSTIETYLANSPIKWALVTGAMITMTLVFAGWVKPGWVRKRYGWNALSIILFLLIILSTTVAFWLIPYDDYASVFAGGHTLSPLPFALSIPAIILGFLLLSRIAQSMMLRIIVGILTSYVFFSFLQGGVIKASYSQVLSTGWSGILNKSIEGISERIGALLNQQQLLSCSSKEAKSYLDSKYSEDSIASKFRDEVHNKFDLIVMGGIDDEKAKEAITNPTVLSDKQWEDKFSEKGGKACIKSIGCTQDGVVYIKASMNPKELRRVLEHEAMHHMIDSAKAAKPRHKKISKDDEEKFIEKFMDMYPDETETQCKTAQ